ncbi:hypothetical protein SEA_MRMIYAGI_40 [Mycobacterium phage MrMiyagi]|uniref:Uncharacterized protein n=1 Tax=Mycobacterium phage MrMiyagi TaxID=2762395 RepID=A0A7G8LPT2_9CAUD|nr:hypothetical protein SEA_MRMIYAGI_40 [Mycobacterium phage MrMiyagi]
MKVCAHMNLGPFKNHHERFESASDAVENFRESLEAFYGDLKGIVERTGEDYRPSLDLYPECSDCNSHMNFHDYPMTRYEVGNRGGIRKVIV